LAFGHPQSEIDNLQSAGERMFPLVGYLLLFVVIGSGFILINLLIGKLIRPERPHEEKATIYECGEPTIGSAWVQFDLRFYVVALLFVIFDVEVAFFFPWAQVFGQANAVAQVKDLSKDLDTPAKIEAYRERVRDLVPPYKENEAILKEYAPNAPNRFGQADIARNRAAARKLGWFALWDIAIFFGVLLVGFAYLWRRGDLQWVRSVSSPNVVPLQKVVTPAPRETAAAS
jgi:NADH-quinone oxidoreductase subunit A